MKYVVGGERKKTADSREREEAILTTYHQIDNLQKQHTIGERDIC